MNSQVVFQGVRNVYDDEVEGDGEDEDEGEEGGRGFRVEMGAEIAIAGKDEEEFPV